MNLIRKKKKRKVTQKKKNNKEKNTDTNTDKDLSYISNRLDTRYGVGNQTVENDGLIDMIEDGDDKIRTLWLKSSIGFNTSISHHKRLQTEERYRMASLIKLKSNSLGSYESMEMKLWLRAVDTAITNTVGKVS